ncbi:MAG TPA: hypothetical protein VJT49_18955 [Amycolatopsis sp.]|uniref:hypothetical protein n=1 Tax=Amycolatopsis sp. TaxID=37632 RepID=UPI002B4A5E02|nr:hypothetical protein [Amycolatopsis sp.]HKS47146.1 hypothetical protein [Amycolatopsis sp.]
MNRIEAAANTPGRDEITISSSDEHVLVACTPAVAACGAIFGAILGAGTAFLAHNGFQPQDDSDDPSLALTPGMSVGDLLRSREAALAG